MVRPIEEENINVATIQNLIVNPGFEINVSGSPTPWQKKQSGTKAVFKYPETGRGGTGSCVSIEYSLLDIGKQGYWTQILNIDHTKIYSVSGWMRTNNISGNGASIQIDWYSGIDTGYISTDYILHNQTGTISWTNFKKSITPPINAVTAGIYLRLSNCTGKVWFDDTFFGEYLNPTTGNVSCTTNPSGAQIYLDGGTNSLGKTPYILTNITIGTHYVIYILANFKDCRIENIDVSAGGITNAPCKMEHLVGSIYCYAKNSEGASLPANVYLDGSTTSLGISPLALNNIYTGNHSVTYKYSGYNDCTKNITVSTNQRTDATCIMVVPAGDTIRVYITDPDSPNYNHVVTLDIESEYLPFVVVSENDLGGIESTKVQAVCSRTYAYYRKLVRPRSSNFDLYDNQSDQVYHPWKTITDKITKAVSETNGIILRWGTSSICITQVNVSKVIIASFYVNGDVGSDTAKYVTYNEGKCGDNIIQSTIGYVSQPPSLNPYNRGCMGQIQSNSLDTDKGYIWQKILKYFYGEDIIIESI